MNQLLSKSPTKNNLLMQAQIKKDERKKFLLKLLEEWVPTEDDNLIAS